MMMIPCVCVLCAIAIYAIWPDKKPTVFSIYFRPDSIPVSFFWLCTAHTGRARVRPYRIQWTRYMFGLQHYL